MLIHCPIQNVSGDKISFGCRKMFGRKVALKSRRYSHCEFSRSRMVWSTNNLVFFGMLSLSSLPVAWTPVVSTGSNLARRRSIFTCSPPAGGIQTRGQTSADTPWSDTNQSGTGQRHCVTRVRHQVRVVVWSGTGAAAVSPGVLTPTAAPSSEPSRESSSGPHRDPSSGN